jgi:hypothetical protein
VLAAAADAAECCTLVLGVAGVLLLGVWSYKLLRYAEAMFAGIEAAAV